MYPDLHQRMEEKIATHGVGLQGVTELIPGEGTFAYTIGHHRQGLPELIVFAPAVGAAADLLQRLSAMLRLGEIAGEAGREVPGQCGRGGELPVRFGAVDPRWAHRHALGVYRHHPDADPADIRVLQVIVPDAEGRFWDDPDHNVVMDQVQPDLSRPEWPWRAPLEPVHLHQEVEEFGPGPWPLLVSVPIIEAGEEIGRCEAVPAVPLEGDLALIQRPPLLADWVTVGTVVEIDEEPAAATRLGPARGYRRVVRESTYVQANWLHRVESEEQTELLLATLAAIEDDLDAVLSVTYASTHVAATPAAAPAVRVRMRRLVRDGIAWEKPVYHSSELGDCPPGCCDQST
jgi:hypothetical protein